MKTQVQRANYNTYECVENAVGQTGMTIMTHITGRTNEYQGNEKDRAIA